MLLSDFFTLGSSTCRMIALAGMCIIPCTSMAQGEGDISKYINEQAFGAVAEILDRGDAAYNNNDMQTAVEEYQKARQEASSRILPKSYREQLDARYAQALAQLGWKEAFEGKVDIGRPKIEEAFKLAPDAPGVRIAKEKIDDPARVNPAATAKNAENVKAVTALLIKAQGATQLGLYDEAKINYTAVLRLDPHNKTARRGMENVNKLMMDYARSSRDHYRSEVLMEVSKAWEQPLAPEVKVEIAEDDFTGTMDMKATQASIANSIILPRLTLDGVNILEAIDYLRNQARQIDPKKQGVNILADIGALDSPSAQGILNRRFNVQMTNVPLSEALRYVAEMSGTQLRNTEYALRLVSEGKDSTALLGRSFQIPPGFFSGEAARSDEDASDPFSSNSSSGGVQIRRVDPKTFLEKSGVTFPDNALATYNAGSGTLLVRNTPANLSLIEDIISSHAQKSPAQVIIKTTFVEVNMTKLKELGFDWIVGFTQLGGNAGRLLSGGTDALGAITGDLPEAPENHPHQNGVMTAGLRSGTEVFHRDSIDDLINTGNERLKATISKQRAPGILSGRFVFSNADIEVIMRGLDQSKAADVMEQPQVIARPGEKAVFQNIREFIYPTDYTEPQLPNSMGNDDNIRGTIRVDLETNTTYVSTFTKDTRSFPVTPSHPTGFATRPVGVTMEVEPLGMSDDRSTVEIQIAPELVEFDGYVNYGSPIMSSGLSETSESGIDIIVLSENNILQPVFTKRSLGTTVTLASGSTVVLGGVLNSKKEKFQDKVPVFGDLPLVGRLFRSQGERTEERAILIMVRADIVDPSGRKIQTLPSGEL